MPTYLHKMANLQPSTMQCTTTLWNLCGQFLYIFCDHIAMDQAVTSLILSCAYRRAQCSDIEAKCCLVFKFNLSLLILTILILFICLPIYLFIFNEDA